MAAKGEQQKWLSDLKRPTGLRQFIRGSEVPDKIKEQPVLSHFPILSSKYDNCDESSTGSGVRRLGHQLWSIWTKNRVANRSKPTKKRGQGSPPHAPHTQEQPAHSREMASVVDTNLVFVSDGAAAPLAGERTHDTCWRTGWGLGERLSFLWDFNKETSLWPKSWESQFWGRLRSPRYPRRRKGSGALEEDRKWSGIIKEEKRTNFFL